MSFRRPPRRPQQTRASGLPPSLVTLLDLEKKKRGRIYAIKLCVGAVAAGLAVGAAPHLLRSRPSSPTQATPASTTADAAAKSLEQLSAGTEPLVQPAAQTEPWVSAARFGFCHVGGGRNCVVDGDTIWLEGQKIRIADIDAPETHDFQCAAEKALGDRATQRLIQLLNGGRVTLRAIDRDEDRYGRKLRIVAVDGRGVGDILVGEGLVRYYEGGRKPWC